MVNCNLQTQPVLLAEFVVGILQHFLRVVSLSSDLGRDLKGRVNPKMIIEVFHLLELHLVGVEVEEVPVVGLAARLQAAFGRVVLVHLPAGLRGLQEVVDVVHVDAAVGVIAEAEHLEETLVLAGEVLSAGDFQSGANFETLSSLTLPISRRVKLAKNAYLSMLPWDAASSLYWSQKLAQVASVP